jgi:hypothetical protein
MKYVLDTETKTARSLLGRLRKKKGIIACNFGGMYHMDKTLCQLHILSDLTEGDLDEWLYKTKGINYIGLISCHEENMDIECNIEYDDYDWENMTGLPKYRGFRQ